MDLALQPLLSLQSGSATSEASALAAVSGLRSSRPVGLVTGGAGAMSVPLPLNGWYFASLSRRLATFFCGTAWMAQEAHASPGVRSGSSCVRAPPVPPCPIPCTGPSSRPSPSSAKGLPGVCRAFWLPYPLGASRAALFLLVVDVCCSWTLLHPSSNSKAFCHQWLFTSDECGTVGDNVGSQLDAAHLNQRFPGLLPPLALLQVSTVTL